MFQECRESLVAKLFTNVPRDIQHLMVLLLRPNALYIMQVDYHRTHIANASSLLSNDEVSLVFHGGVTKEDPIEIAPLLVCLAETTELFPKSCFPILSSNILRRTPSIVVEHQTLGSHFALVVQVLVLKAEILRIDKIAGLLFESLLSCGRLIHYNRCFFFALYKGLTAVYTGIVPKMAIRFLSFEQYKIVLNDASKKFDVNVPTTAITSLLLERC